MAGIVTNICVSHEKPTGIGGLQACLKGNCSNPFQSLGSGEEQLNYTATSFEDVKQAAAGHWPEVLTYLGIDAGALSGKHVPCPGCGGRDRFRWDAGKEAFFCGQGGSTTGGDGFSLLEHCGWTKADALYAVAQYLHVEKVMLSAEQRQGIQHHNRQTQLADLDDGIFHECHILMQTTAGRKNNRDLEHNHKFKEARPDWMPYQTEVWDRELLAAKRLTKMLEARYGV